MIKKETVDKLSALYNARSRLAPIISMIERYGGMERDRPAIYAVIKLIDGYNPQEDFERRVPLSILEGHIKSEVQRIDAEIAALGGEV